MEETDRKDGHRLSFQNVRQVSWVVERTFAWIGKHLRTVCGCRYLPASHEGR